MKTYLTLFFLSIFSFSFSQGKNNSDIIFSNTSDSQIASILATKKYNAKDFVFYNNKFYSVDTLKTFKNLKDYTMNIIEIPDSITKDIRKLILLKKAIN